jgi:2-haloacid dehalogenase
MPVRNVVFDIGGVLLDWNPRHLYRGLVEDPAEIEWFLAEVCTTEWNATLDAGRSFDEACDELAAEHPEHAELVHAWKRQDDMIVGEVPGTAEIVRSLRAQSVPLFLLTNMPTHVFASRMVRYDVLHVFDGAVVSGDEGVLKPSREIFRRLLDRFDLEAAETLFIDDSEVNVEGARAAGLQAHHFAGAADLRRALADLGLLA